MFVSDVDEIVSREWVDSVRAAGLGRLQCIAAPMRMHQYGLDWQSPERWAGTTVAVLGSMTAQQMRDRRGRG